MGSLGLTATAMAARSAFVLLCFALLCGLVASSGFQSETETELRTKIEGEAAGNQVLVAEAVESRVARGSKREDRKRQKTAKGKKGGKTNKNPKNKPNKKGKKTRKNRRKQIKKKNSKKG